MFKAASIISRTRRESSSGLIELCQSEGRDRKEERRRGGKGREGKGREGKGGM